MSTSHYNNLYNIFMHFCFIYAHQLYAKVYINSEFVK